MQTWDQTGECQLIVRTISAGSFVIVWSVGESLLHLFYLVRANLELSL